MHYPFKVHIAMNSPYQLATLPSLLDIVEQLIGPDILLYNTTYIINEAHTESHVSWRQDLTYWGLDADAQVSVWLALSEASEASGCMPVIPPSHIYRWDYYTITIYAINRFFSHFEACIIVCSAENIIMQSLLEKLEKYPCKKTSIGRYCSYEYRR